MGQTRTFLNTINASISVHNIEKSVLIKKFCENPNLEKFYRHQIDAFDQKFEKTLRSMINDHIHYLEEKDPYGRQPLWGAEVKKELFVKVRQELESCHGLGFIQALSNKIENLLTNPVIDQPRWPQLKLDNLYYLFKSILSNKTAHSDNSNKHDQSPKR